MGPYRFRRTAEFILRDPTSLELPERLEHIDQHLVFRSVEFGHLSAAVGRYGDDWDMQIISA